MKNQTKIILKIMDDGIAILTTVWSDGTEDSEQYPSFNDAFKAAIDQIDHGNQNAPGNSIYIDQANIYRHPASVQIEVRVFAD